MDLEHDKKIREEVLDDFLNWFDTKYGAFELEGGGYTLYGDMHYPSVRELKREYLFEREEQPNEEK